jgi:hypothetical protein
MEACGACGLETGTIVLKKQGSHTQRGGSLLPKYMVNPESRCEYCHFLGAFFASEKIEVEAEPKLKWGAAKFVTEDKVSGVRTLLAYVPFNSEDDVDKKLSDGTGFRMRHGTVVECVKHDDGTAEMVKVLEQGT